MRKDLDAIKERKKNENNSVRKGSKTNYNQLFISKSQEHSAKTRFQLRSGWFLFLCLSFSFYWLKNAKQRVNEF